MPDYGQVYESLIKGKTEEEIAGIKETMKAKYDYDPDASATEGKITPVQTETDATVQETEVDASNTQSSGDSSVTQEAVEEIPARVSEVKANFNQGKFKGEEREAFNAYKAGDLDWWKKLPQYTRDGQIVGGKGPDSATEFEGLQETIDKVATEKFEKEQAEKTETLNTEVSDEVQRRLLDDPKIKTAVDTYVSTLDTESKQQELVKKYDLRNNPDNIPLAEKELNDWIREQINNFTSESPTLKGIQDELIAQVLDERADEFRAIDQEKYDFYGQLRPEDADDGVFAQLFKTQQNKGAIRSRETRLHEANIAVNEATPGTEDYERAVQNRNIESSSLNAALNRQTEYEYSLRANNPINEVTFYDEDGFLGIDWGNVFDNPGEVWTELKKQLPQSAVALSGNLFGSSLIFAVPSSLFFWSQMHNEYMDNATTSYLDDKYGQGRWSNKEYLEFVQTPEWKELRNTSLLHSSWTGQLDRFSDAFPFLGKGSLNKKLGFAIKNIAEKLGTNSFKKFLIKAGAGTVKVGTSAWLEGQTEVLQETVGEGISESFKSDWEKNILETTKDWYLDRDKLTEAQQRKFGEARALGTIAGGAFGSVGAVATPIADVAGRTFDIDFLKDKTLSEQFESNPAQFSFLDKKTFNDNIEKVSTPFRHILNDPNVDPALKRRASIKLMNLLDTQAAFNAADEYKINKTGKTKAIGLLTERAQLQRQVDLAANNGLAAQDKERIKAIDEQLDRIQRTNKQKQQDSPFERLRRIVGPRRSVGAARKSNIAQQVLDRVDGLYRAAEGKISEFSRLPDVVSDIGVTEEEAAQLREQVEVDAKQAQAKGFATISAMYNALDKVQEMQFEGAAQEEIDAYLEKQAKASQQATVLTTDSTIESDIDALIDYENNTAQVTTGAVANQAFNTKLDNASTADIRNRKWAAESGLYKQANQAKKKIASLKKQSVERNALTLASLSEFVDVQSYVDALVRKYANTSLDVGYGKGYYDKLIESILNLDNATGRKAKAQLKKKIVEMDKLYNLALLDVEQVIANRGAKTNQYPPYFNPATGKFFFQFNNKFGNSVLYDMFPDNGQAIFEAMTISEWGDFMNKVGIWESKEGKQRDKERAKLEKFASEKYEKYKDAERTNYIAINEKAQRSKAGKAAESLVYEDIYGTPKHTLESDFFSKERQAALDQYSDEIKANLEDIVFEMQRIAGHTGWYYLGDNGVLYDATGKYATIPGIVHDRAKIVEEGSDYFGDEEGALAAYKRLLLWMYAQETPSEEDQQLLRKELRSLKHIGAYPLNDTAFTQAIEKLKNPDGTVTIARAIPFTDDYQKPTSTDIGGSWTVSNSVVEGFEQQGQRRAEGSLTMYMDIDLDSESVELIPIQSTSGNTEAEIYLYETASASKNVNVKIKDENGKVVDEYQLKGKTTSSKQYSLAEKENAQIKWESMAKLPRIKFEGEILYQISQGNEVSNELLGKYAMLVGRTQAEAFVQSVIDSEFVVPIGATAAMTKYDLVRQLWLSNVVDGTVDADSKLLTNIANDSHALTIASLQTRIVDVENVVDNAEEGLAKENAREQLIELNKQLIAAKKNQDISLNLPVIPSVTGTTSSMANIISYAGLIVTGDYNGLPDSVVEGIEVDLEGERSLEDFKGDVAKFQAATAEINNIANQQANIAAQIKSILSSTPVEEQIDARSRNRVESLIDKSNQIEAKKESIRQVQAASAASIVAVQQGKVKVEGLEGEIANIELADYTSDKVSNKEVAARLKDLNEQIEKLQKQIDNTSSRRKKLKMLNKQSLLKFEAEAARGLLEMDRSQFDLESDIADVGLSLTAKQREELKAREEKAEQIYRRMFTYVRNAKLSVREDQDAGVLIDIPADQIISAIAYALKVADEASFPTMNDFIADIASQLSFPVNGLTNREIRVKKARAADYLVSMLENRGLIAPVEPVKVKDPWTFDIVNPQFVTDLIYADTKENLPSADKAAKIKLDARQWTELQFERPVDWNNHTHETGLEMVSKLSEADQMSKADFGKVYDILNRAKDTRMNVRQGPLNIAKQMFLLKHPAFDFTNKNYTPEQRQGKIRELEAILFKAEYAGDRDFYSLFKFGSRGRLYSSTSYLNHQAAKLANSFIQLTNPEAMGLKGYKWLLSDIAENAGVKANTLEELAAATNENMVEWMKWIANPRKYRDKIYGDKDGKGGVDEPHLFVSGMYELREAIKHGDPTTYKSSYVPYIDASVSGVQILGSALRDQSALKWVNLTPGLYKEDLYTEVFNRVAAKLFILNPTDEQLKQFTEIDNKLKDFEDRAAAAKRRDYQEFLAYQKEVKDRDKRDLTDEEVETYWESKRVFVLPGKKVLDEETGEKQKTVRKVTEATYIKYLKKQYRGTVDMDFYNGVFWGQQQWLERGRKAGKKPVMTSTYNAAVSSMADGLYKEFSVEKGVSIQPENTSWIAKHLNGELQATLPNVTKLKNYLQDLALALAANGQDFGFRGPVTDFNYIRRYREADTIRLNHKSKLGNIQLSHAIGDKESITEKALKFIKNGVVANFTHALDKELVGDLYLNFKHDLLTVHDAFGTKLANMDELYFAIRESHKRIFDKPVLENILKQNISDPNQVQADLAYLMVNTWDSEDVFHNQHNYGKSGKADTQKNVQDIFTRAGVDPATRTDRTISESHPSQPDTTVKYEGGNIVIEQSPEYVEALANKVKTPIQELVAIDLASNVEKQAGELFYMSRSVRKGNGDVVNVLPEATQLVAAVDAVNKSLGDINELAKALEVFERVSDAYKKAIRGAENKLHNAYVNAMKEQYLTFFLNTLETVEEAPEVKVKSYQETITDLIKKIEPTEEIKDASSVALPEVSTGNKADIRTCEI